MKTIACVLFIFITLLPASQTIYMQSGNIFSNSFTEPMEVLYIVFYDGYFIRFTSRNETGIYMPYSVFKETINKKGRKIKDIAIAIHNHLPGYGQHFSNKDILFYMRMRGDEFNGSFCLRTQGGKIRRR